MYVWRVVALEHEVTESQGHPSWAMSISNGCFCWLPTVQYIHFQNGSITMTRKQQTVVLFREK